MTSVTGSVAAGDTLPCRGLDEVTAGQHGQPGRAPDVVVRPELARLQDHLQVCVAAGLLHLDDLVVDLRVAAGEESAAVDHHVDLVGAQLDGCAHVGELHLEWRLARRELGRHRRNLDRRSRKTGSRRQGRGLGTRTPRLRGHGIPGSAGSGLSAFEHNAVTLPAVSDPSSVVRSIIRTESRSAKSLASFLIERFAELSWMRTPPVPPRRSRRSAGCEARAEARSRAAAPGPGSCGKCTPRE